MKDLLKELVPPELPVVARYRLAISGAVLGLMISAGAGWGLFATFGIPGFAYASDLNNLKSDVRSIKMDLLEERIYNAQRLWCSTETQESKRFYSQQISTMHRQYYAETGITISIPTCAEFGK